MVDQEANVIVAIPRQNDPVWKISSEKTPHMTILYLEDLSQDDKFPDILEFLQHAVTTSMARFGLDVDHRGTLGSDKADVLFFSNSWIREIRQFRQTLLQNTDIFQAYSNVEQYPEWTPHLTLGYPATPAHPDNRDYPGIDYISFDKIAIWTGDYEGVEFPLKDNYSQYDPNASMSESIDHIFSHHGVKGMHWGVRKDRSGSSESGDTTRSAGGRSSTQAVKARVKKEYDERTSSEITVRAKPGQQVRVVGGTKRSASSDAIAARSAEQIAKRNTLDALSNKELQSLVTRMNLESQYRNLAIQEDRRSAGEKFATDLATSYGGKYVEQFAGPAAPAVRTAMETAMKNSNKALNSGVANEATVKARRKALGISEKKKK